MPALLRMPGVAANATEAVLAEWHVAENAPFAKADPIAVVETDKANVDIEAENAGIIIKYLVEPGTEVEVGAPIALTGQPGETITDIDQILQELGAVTEESYESDTSADTVTAAGAPATSAPATINGSDPSRQFVTPLVRRLAREANLDLRGVTGTGPNGRIVKRDVVDLLQGEPATTHVAPTPPSPAPTPAQASGPTTAYTDIPHTRMRKAIASRLAESKQTAPHFYVRGSAKVDALLALRQDLNAASEVKISVNDLIVKAAAKAHSLVPAMNVTWLEDAVRQFDSIDIAVAVASDKGLTTPVVRDVANRGIAAVAADTRDLAERAREGRLKQNELEGGTLSISNLGMFGTEEFAAIINPPQAAILAVGAAKREAVVTNDQLGVATVLRVTLSVDHRPVDGATAAEWMRSFLELLEAPMRILL